MKHFQYNEPIKSQTGVEAVQIEYLDRPVRFSFRHCTVKKKHCVSNVVGDKQLLQTTYNRFGVLEGMTWQQARGINHKKGISIESKGSTNHQELSREWPEFDTFGHFRVNATTKAKFRIFGALQGDCFCILRFDVDGEMNH